MSKPHIEDDYGAVPERAEAATTAALPPASSRAVAICHMIVMLLPIATFVNLCLYTGSRALTVHAFTTVAAIISIAWVLSHSGPPKPKIVARLMLVIVILSVPLQGFILAMIFVASGDTWN